MFVIIVGNPCDGMSFYGPFEDGNEANEYADERFSKEDWWVARLEAPVAQQDRAAVS